MSAAQRFSTTAEQLCSTAQVMWI